LQVKVRNGLSELQQQKELPNTSPAWAEIAMSGNKVRELQ